MIQIGGIREKGHVFFDKNIVAPDVSDILRDPLKYLEPFKEEDRVNMYFTVHHIDPNNQVARSWGWQDIIPFDIDDIDPNTKEEVVRVACEALGVNFDMTGSLFSGHGVQLFIKIEQKITDAGFFTENREVYKLLCQKINSHLKKAGLKGNADPAVFTPRRLMRYPETWNSKPKKGPDVLAHPIQRHMEYQGFTLDGACGMRAPEEHDVVHRKAWSNYKRLVDTEGVLQGCGFIKYCGENQDKVTEEQWHALCGTLGFLPTGKQLIHEYSNKYKGYSYEETEWKVNHAAKVSGPRKCESISKIFDGCKACPHFGVCTTPLQIRREEFIATEGSGFYEEYTTKDGKEGRNPEYSDLAKYYKREQGTYFCCGESERFYTYSKEKRYWESVPKKVIESFAQNTFKPEPRSHIVNEFTTYLLRKHVESSDWMQESVKNKINLQNGVLDVLTGELTPHSDKYGFMSILPYAYDASAKCPNFEKFLREITCNREDLANLIVEFMGYAISGDDVFIDKCLILLGEGENGKSTLARVLKDVVGEGYYSSLSLDALNSEQNRCILEGKLFNIGDENSPGSFLKSDIFKSLVSGEDFTMKEVYKKPKTVRNKVKMIFNCNQMPRTSEQTHAFFRRLVFVPFDAVFSDELGNKDAFLAQKLKAELPGILNLAIDGFRRLKKREHLIMPEVSQKIMTAYKAETEDCIRFIEEWLEPDPEGFEPAADVYNAYVSFCDREHIKYPAAKIEFGRKLAKHCDKWDGFGPKFKKDRGRSMRGFSGIKLIRGF